MDKKEYEELTKEFELTDPDKILQNTLENVLKGKLKIKNNDTNLEVSIDDISVDLKNLKVTGGAGSVSLDKDISSDCKLKLKVNGKIEDLELTKLTSKFSLQKDIVNDDVSILLEYKDNLLTLNSPIGQRDFSASISFTKRF